jgi:predicted DNA-binding protein (UPF0278 family)
MAKSKKRVHNTTKNTNPKVYKMKKEYVEFSENLHSVAKNISREDAAIVEAKVLTQSNEKLFEHIIEMFQSGVLYEFIEDTRSKLSKSFPIFKDKIMEREMFVVCMFLTKSLIDNDTETINDWSNNFKENPMNVIIKALKFVEFVRNDKDMSGNLSKLDKIVDWNA